MQFIGVRYRLLLLVAALIAVLLPMSPAVRADPNPDGRTTYGYIRVAQDTTHETTLGYKVELPDPDRFGSGPYPTVVDYSGYEPGIYIFDGLAEQFLQEGYAVAGVNMRGTGCSGGKFDYFEPLQSRDGAEAIDFLGRQPWSNGRVAMVGKSYPGITQLFVAAQQPKHLVAIVPGHVFADLYRDVPYPGGILNATFAGGWSAGRIFDQAVFIPDHKDQQSDQQCMRNQADHAPNPAFNPFIQALKPENNFDGPLYQERSPWYFAHEITVPTMLVEAFQDEQVGSRAMELIERLRPGLDWRMAVTNGDHGEYYGDELMKPIKRFLSYHLKQEKPADEPPAYAGLTYAKALAKYKAEDRVLVNFENGALGGRKAAFAKTFKSWPPPQQQVWRLGLGPDGSLGVPATSAAAGKVDYTYAPGIGSQERGGQSLYGAPAAAWSDRPAEGTSASFTTAPLDADKMLFGPASADLWISSTAADTDFEVTVSEVRPDGKEMFVQQGWLRASHRMLETRLSTPTRPYQTHKIGDVQPLVPGTATPVRIEIFPFGHVFRAGSKLRFTVAAPHIKPDLWGFTALPLPARNTIYTGGLTPSSLALPLMAGVKAPTPLPPCTLRSQPCRDEPAA